MKLAGLAIGILLAAGQVWAADLNATLKKAKSGDVISQYQLAEHYAEADGVDQDYEEALKWARQAAYQGNAKAKYRMASILFLGVTGEARQPEALQLFRESAEGLEKLAEEGDADARAKLGILCARGIGVEKDVERAAKLFTQAAEAGVVKAQVDLAGAYLLGNGVGRNATTAGEWFTKAAKSGHGQAQVQLGMLCIQGTGREQDIDQGMNWLRKASAHRNPEFSKQAKSLLDRLEDSPPKLGPDMKALRQRAQKGELKAQLELAQRHEIGAGVPVNEAAVCQWLNAATLQGSAAAAHRLGGILMLGRGAVKKEPALAASYWKLAAELGYGGAQVDYAVACAKGDGLEKNMPEAYYWALIARRGNTSEEQERNLRALQGVITSGLEPEEILSGLTRSRSWKAPTEEKAKLRWVKAQFGNAGAQLELGKSLVESRPREALKWLKLAAAAKEKGAAATAKELAGTLSKKEIDQVQAAVKAFKPLK